MVSPGGVLHGCIRQHEIWKYQSTSKTRTTDDVLLPSGGGCNFWSIWLGNSPSPLHWRRKRVHLLEKGLLVVCPYVEVSPSVTRIRQGPLLRTPLMDI